MRGGGLLRRVTLAWLAAAAAAINSPRGARACSIPGPITHQTDPAEQALDQTPPSAPSPPSIELHRGVGPKSEGCGRQSASSCDDLGRLTLRLTASDDRTPVAALGYRLELVSGALPDGLTLPATAVRPSIGDALFLVWNDGAVDAQEALSFTLRITAVDRAGNAGPGVLVSISDEGGSGGCVVGGGIRGAGAVGGSFVASLLAVAVLRRRHRRCSPRPPAAS